MARARLSSVDDLITDYLDDLRLLLSQVDVSAVRRVVEALQAARRNGSQVFIIGNGGSAATASHFACDLAKTAINGTGLRLRAIALTDSVALITAWSNDSHYQDVFVEQLANLLDPDDIVIAISASGRSENILKAVRFARSREAVTIGLSGFGGGELQNLVDIGVVVPSASYGQVEDMHLVLQHLITACLKEIGDAESDLHRPRWRDQRESARPRKELGRI